MSVPGTPVGTISRVNFLALLIHALASHHILGRQPVLTKLQRAKVPCLTPAPSLAKLRAGCRQGSSYPLACHRDAVLVSPGASSSLVRSAAGTVAGEPAQYMKSSSPLSHPFCPGAAAIAYVLRAHRNLLIHAASKPAHGNLAPSAAT